MGKRFEFTCSYEFLEDRMSGDRNSYSEKLPSGDSIMWNFDGNHSLVHVIIKESQTFDGYIDRPSGKDSCLKHWRG
jgi:hypothetical protein